MAIARTHILVCGGTGCSSSHSQALIDELNRELEEKGLLGEVQGIKTGCFGLCALGPVVVVYPEGCFYSHVTEADIPEIVEEHILKGRIVTRLLYQETVVDDKTIKNLNHTKFYEKQHRVALRNCGVINPENIDEYIAMDGYEALGRVLTGMTPDEVIQTIKDSGLRGRGGGGYVHYHGGAGAVLPAVPEQHSGNHDDFGHEGLREGGKPHEKNEEVPPDGAGGAGHFLLLRGSLGGRRAALHEVQLRLLG